MSAFLFTGSVSQTRPADCGGCSTARYPQDVDLCQSLIVHAPTLEVAQGAFESSLLRPGGQENPLQTEITKVVAAPFMEQLLGESGALPIDWSSISEQMQASSDNLPIDDFEQGYWVDVEQAIDPGNLPADIESLQNEMPEDVRSGLNWSPDKQFFFIISALKPHLLAPEFADEPEHDLVEQPTGPQGDDCDESDSETPDRAEEFPELEEKEAAGLIQARNSVVAAWLWRRNAVGTPLALHPIRVDPWCGAMTAGAA
jgi:hypothetical protein